jgi:hypothetical protein
MLQKFLDGKKKYSAFIITVLATMIPLFVQDPEVQKTVLDMVPSAAAALAGIFYIVTQGKVDREKEVVKALNGNGAAVATQTLTQTTPAQAQAQSQPVVEQPTPFDQVTDCQHISQAVDYWNYLVDLAVDARDWLKEQTEKKAGTCGRSPEYYVFTRDFNATIRAANALAELASSKVDWKSKLAPFNRTLYGVGVLAEQLLNPN